MVDCTRCEKIPFTSYEQCLYNLITFRVYRFEVQNKTIYSIACIPVGLLLIAISFFLFLRFKQHPYPIYAVELVFLAGYVAIQTEILYMFKIPFYKATHLTYFWRDVTYKDYYEWAAYTIKYNSLLRDTYASVFVLWYFFIYLDLYLLLRDPFYPREKRMVKYLFWTLVNVSLGVTEHLLVTIDNYVR